MPKPQTQSTRSPWTLVSIAQALLWFFALPSLIKPYWEPFWSDIRAWSPTACESALNLTPIWMVILCSMGMFPVYYCQHPFFEQYKISHKPWPWLRSEPKARRDKFWAQSTRSIKLLAFNALLIPALTALKVNSASLGLAIPDLSFSEADWPSYPTMFYHHFLLTLLHELFFYISHRILHLPWFYRFHKVHHEYKQNNILAAQHNHPVDYVLSIAGPALLATVIVQPHSATQWCWGIYVVLTNVDDHIGYSFPWAPMRWFPLAGLTEHHEFHHQINMGCFASKLVIWDKLFKSEERYTQWATKRKTEWEQEQRQQSKESKEKKEKKKSS